jgi:hypothetical protein
MDTSLCIWQGLPSPLAGEGGEVRQDRSRVRGGDYPRAHEFEERSSPSPGRPPSPARGEGNAVPDAEARP